MAVNPTKLSQLDEISSSNISEDDLLLVSDKEAENGQSYKSKKMTMQQMVRYTNKTILSSDDFKQGWSVYVMDIVKDHPEEVADLLDDVVQHDYFIDAGGAGELGPDPEEDPGE